jgi:hypothetical protein
VCTYRRILSPCEFLEILCFPPSGTGGAEAAAAFCLSRLLLRPATPVGPHTTHDISRRTTNFVAIACRDPPSTPLPTLHHRNRCVTAQILLERTAANPRAEAEGALPRATPTRSTLSPSHARERLIHAAGCWPHEDSET